MIELREVRKLSWAQIATALGGTRSILAVESRYCDHLRETGAKGLALAKQWTDEEDSTLRDGRQRGHKFQQIAKTLAKRPVSAVRKRWAVLKLDMANE